MTLGQRSVSDVILKWSDTSIIRSCQHFSQEFIMENNIQGF